MRGRGLAVVAALVAACLLCAASAAGADGARLTISRSSAAPGARVVLAGHGLARRARFRVTLARVAVARGRTGRRGGVRAAFRVPSRAPGLYRLRIRMRGRTVAWVRFRVGSVSPVNTPLSPAPQSPPPAPQQPAPAPQDPGPGPPDTGPPDPDPGITGPTLVAAGDIACSQAQQAAAGPSACHQAATASRVEDLDPDAVAVLGDNQYQSGELADFNLMFEPSWGAFKDITHPAIGNHEYEGDDRPQRDSAPGYFAYFGDVAAGPGGYYRWSLGDWTMFVLNSGAIDYTREGHAGAANADDCWPVSCATGSDQLAWLTNQLDSLPDDACVLAYWHHPLFSSGYGGDNQDYPETRPMFQALYDHGAELVLNGHAHNYERFQPIEPSGTVDADHGIMRFVVGTGGRNLFPNPGPQESTSVTLRTDLFGVLELTLGSSGWKSRFVTEAGDSLDETSGTCHGPPEPPPTP
jgi:Calcineurin-like phosphoesterase